MVRPAANKARNAGLATPRGAFLDRFRLTFGRKPQYFSVLAVIGQRLSAPHALAWCRALGLGFLSRIRHQCLPPQNKAIRTEFIEKAKILNENDGAIKMAKQCCQAESTIGERSGCRSPTDQPVDPF